jgi:subfamily B ATP-binding cassette protein HlyB/CyaB
MDRGQVIEIGNHEQLMELNGYYAKLHSYQDNVPNIRPVINRDRPIEPGIDESQLEWQPS